MPPAIHSVVLAVCTRRRPVLFTELVKSLSRLVVPPDRNFHVVVADNNPEKHYCLYIGDLLRGLPFESSYDHEPAAGYTNARNKALELALQVPADLLAFVDDDVTLDANWLIGHLRSYDEFACDVVGGAIHGGSSRHKHGRRFTHGEQRPTIGTCNVSFRRWLAADDGLGLRFDPRFNRIGGEDKAFFSKAHHLGATIIVSAYPVVEQRYTSEDDRIENMLNKAEVSSIMRRNEVVTIRKEQGRFAATVAAVGGIRFGIKSLAAYLDFCVSAVLLVSSRKERKRLSAYKNFSKMIDGFKGLNGEYIARYDIRRSF
jgi:hypothetical protein